MCTFPGLFPWLGGGAGKGPGIGWSHDLRILGVLGALSIQPNIPKIPGGGANGTDIFLNISFRNFGCNSRGWPKILENSDPFEHSYSGLASPSPEIELSIAASSSVLAFQSDR